MNSAVWGTVAAAGLAWLCAAGGCAGDGAGDDRVVVGYYPASLLKTLPPSALQWKLYTHVIHIGVAPDAAGGVEGQEGQIPSRELVEAGHAHGVPVTLSLVGKADIYAKVCADETLRTRFVAELMRIVKTYDYDGIDVDWEHPADAASGAAWGKLIRALRAGLDALSEGSGKRRKYYLTSALPMGAWVGRWLDRDLMVECLDWVNVMCYDACGPWGGHAGNHSALLPAPGDPAKVSMAAGMEYWSGTKGIPPGKLVMGIPYYGHAYHGYKPYEPFDKAARGKRIEPWVDWSAVHRRVTKEGWTRTFDASSQATWFWSPDGKSFVAADDPEVVAIKARWARGKGYRGVFCWHMGADVLPGGATPLQKAMHDAWHK